MTARPTVRLATPADVPGIAVVLGANDEALEEPGVVGFPYLEFLLGRGRVTVAELAGRIVGLSSMAPPRPQGRGSGGRRPPDATRRRASRAPLPPARRHCASVARMGQNGPDIG